VSYFTAIYYLKSTVLIKIYFNIYPLIEIGIWNGLASKLARAVMLLICAWEVLGSDLDQKANNPASSSSPFFSVCPRKFQDNASVMLWSLPSTYFPSLCSLSFSHLTLYGLNRWNFLKWVTNINEMVYFHEFYFLGYNLRSHRCDNLKSNKFPRSILKKLIHKIVSPAGVTQFL
jgi:hypothetical protein